MRGIRHSELGAMAHGSLLDVLQDQDAPGKSDNSTHLAKKLADEGWWGALVPEEAGGQGLDIRTLASIADALGSTLASVEYLQTAVLPTLILRAAVPVGAANGHLRSLAQGQSRIAVAWQEKADELTASKPAASLSGSLLQGTKQFVQGMANATHVLVTARDEVRGLVAAIIDTSGVAAIARGQIDGTFAHAFDFHGVSVDAADLFSVDPLMVDRALDVCRVLSAALLLAVARRALLVTRDYTLVREQFGKKIGANQVVQHRLVDIGIKIRLAEATLEAAIDGCDASDSEFGGLAAAAKIAATEAAISSGEAAVQLHGAIGYTEEGHVGNYLKAALRWSPWLGSPATLRARFVSSGGTFRNV